MVYKMADLEWKSSRMYRQEPTGDFQVNRNGRRVPVTKGTEYVTTAGAGTLSIAEWCKLMEAAVQAEGKQELLEILSEDLNRLDVRLLLGFLQDFIGDRGVQQTLPRILDGSTDLLR